MTTRIDALSIRQVLLGTGLFALVVRLAYWLLASPDLELTGDAGQYHFLATNLSEGRGFVDVFPQIELHETAFRPPLYPGALSLVFSLLWPSAGIARLVNVLIGTGLVVALAALLYRHLGVRAAIGGAVAAAVAPNLVANDTWVITEPLSLLLLVLLLGAAVERRPVLAGIATGLLLLARPSAQLLALLFVGWFLVTLGWRRALAFAAVVVMIVVPWVARNWIELDSPVLVTSNGFNLAAMYSPPAERSGTFIDPAHHPWFDDRRLAHFDEVAWDRSLRKVAIDNIRDDPTLVSKVAGRNFLAFFELDPGRNDPAEEVDGRHMGVRGATLWIFYATLVAGLAGFWRRRHDTLVVAAALVAAYFTVASVLSVAPPRLRAPVDLMLAIGVGALFAGTFGTSSPVSGSDVSNVEQPDVS